MKTLEQFESELTEAVTTVTLMGQLGYDERDLEALRGALRRLFDASVSVGLRRAGVRYPLAFALYLVLEGVYGYNGGDYWTGTRSNRRRRIDICGSVVGVDNIGLLGMRANPVQSCFLTRL